MPSPNGCAASCWLKPEFNVGLCVRGKAFNDRHLERTIMTKTITMSAAGDEGAFSLFLAEPGGPARAGIVVVQAIYGFNADIRRKCHLLAPRGYLADAPTCSGG